MTKTYIENCFCLTAKRIDKSLNGLRLKRIGDNSDFERQDISYVYDKKSTELCVYVTVAGNEPQKIVFDPFETSWGERNYVICEGCGTRHTKLYLKPGGHTFRCKKCFFLRYETFNPLSQQGLFLKHVQKVLKLVKRQEAMTSRIWYRDVYTKRYEKFLSDCQEVGLTDVVEEARALETSIKAYKQGKIKRTR